MSEGKFASLTAGLLVRKGEARPSSIMPAMALSHMRASERIEMLAAQDWAPAAPAPVRREPPKPLSLVPAATLQHEPQRMEAPFTHGSPPPAATPGAKARKAPPGDPPPPEKIDKPRRLMVTLTPTEYEILGLIGVKKNATRHQLLRCALDEYLALLVEEFSGDCQCINTGGTCNNSCTNN
ncbi:MAG TPA: hypothetical protein VHT51_11690 [Micropepsaceae bacterium]|jgi:hypothetical protein|nr:hypothetical protein [Micropepsaceae bacterium]